ncbi:hypothetical protein SNE40_018495 [Patella caerulea]|uniref:Uncharacterized protein n=1 Tax=Patella caerulea TaxID=87958 RepID=A0AAN8P820_PATCE
MSNYHGPLYDRSCSVFQRRFKQVYFQLNPFLERTSLKDEDAEVYQPSSKYVIPLKSIVVCEEFDREDAKEWKVLDPEKFWEYLYSDSWNDDCSLRVLEGELLELLVMLLCIMEKEEEVSSYLTFAYAKTKRPVHKCYTDATDKKEEFTTETLLIEYIYYGISETKEKEKGGAIVSWRDYKDMAAKAAGLTKLADIVDLLGQKNTNKKKNGGFLSIIRPPKSSSSVSDDGRNARIVSLTLMKWQDNLRAQTTKRQQKNQRHSPRAGERDRAGSPFERPLSNISENGSELLGRMDAILFDKNKKANRNKRNATFFGELLGRRVPPGDEFYINQLKPKNMEGVKIVDLLRENKKTIMAERERGIQEVKELQDRIMKRQLELIDEPHHDSDASSTNKPFVKLYDRRASFGSFYKYLVEEENKFDPRFKKANQRKKKIAEKYKLKKDSKLSDKGLKTNKSSNLSISDKNSTAVVGGDKVISKKISKKWVADRQRFAGEVGGVTDSEAARRHCLQNVTSGHSIKDDSKGAIRGRRTNSMFSDNTYATLPKITSPIREHSSASSHYKSSETATRTSTSSKKLSIMESDSDTESSDSVMDDADDDYVDTVFDTRKLNKKYSIEKIRAIKLKKEKKPPVLNILRKFCRVNRMMNSLAPKAVPSKTPRKSLADANKAKQSAKAFGMFRRLNKKAVAEVKPAVEVGKLKTFNFLKLKDHVSKIPDVDLPNFESTSLDDCKKNLLRALGDFVIRKEKITSSHTYETLTTITFTRPSTYVRMHQIPTDS